MKNTKLQKHCSIIEDKIKENTGWNKARIFMIVAGANLKTLNPPITLNKILSNHLSMLHKLIPSLIPSAFS